MLKLYYAPDNASLIVRLTLEEAGVPYQTLLVDRSVGAQRAPEYLHVNPMGLIPALETPDGVLSETAACLLWLSEQYPEAKLGPQVGDPMRGTFLRWLFFLSNTFHADLRRLFYAERYVPEVSLAAHHDMLAGHLHRHLTIVEKTLAVEPALFKPPSVLALYLGPLLRWSALYPAQRTRWLSLDSFPYLKALMSALEARPSVQKAADLEGLGALPFSQPDYPNPPEGTAL